jgi:hypothetical protein
LIRNEKAIPYLSPKFFFDGGAAIVIKEIESAHNHANFSTAKEK